MQIGDANLCRTLYKSVGQGHKNKFCISSKTMDMFVYNKIMQKRHSFNRIQGRYAMVIKWGKKADIG